MKRSELIRLLSAIPGEDPEVFIRDDMDGALLSIDSVTDEGSYVELGSGDEVDG